MLTYFFSLLANTYFIYRILVSTTIDSLPSLRDTDKYELVNVRLVNSLQKNRELGLTEFVDVPNNPK